MFGMVALHCLLLAGVLFTFGLVALHLAKVLFTLAKDLVNFG